MSSSASSPLLQLEQLTAARPGPQGRPLTILAAISCSFRQGELTTLIGPSGSGKSVLLRLINRLEDPSSGKILLAGEDIRSLSPPLLRQRVGMMLQKACMYEGTVLDNLQMPFYYRKKPLPGPDDPEITRCLTLARLAPDFLQRDARTLSGGEQQRVSLARTLISRPQALLLDEPTSSLDRPTTDSLGQTLLELCRAEQMAVILVTHDLRLARLISDQTIYLEAGRIVEAGCTAELFEQPQSEGLREFLFDPEKLKV